MGAALHARAGRRYMCVKEFPSSQEPGSGLSSRSTGLESVRQQRWPLGCWRRRRGGTQGRDGGGRRWQRGNDFGTGHGSIGAPGQTPSSMPSAGRRGAIGAAARLVGWRHDGDGDQRHRRSRRYGGWDAGVARVCYSGRVRWKGPCAAYRRAGVSWLLWHTV